EYYNLDLYIKMSCHKLAGHSQCLSSEFCSVSGACESCDMCECLGGFDGTCGNCAPAPFRETCDPVAYQSDHMGPLTPWLSGFNFFGTEEDYTRVICSGPVGSWDAGFGGCSTYDPNVSCELEWDTIGPPPMGPCSENHAACFLHVAANGLSAAQVCPQCGLCELPVCLGFGRAWDAGHGGCETYSATDRTA
ncbi:unnamed protein product, partial [Prorocentrum cordatum]